MKNRQGQFADAERLAQQAVGLHYRLHGDGHPETAFGLKVLANAQRQQQKLAEAEKSVREGLAIFRHQFPEDHPNIRDTMDQLRTVLEARGDQPALEALANEEAEIAMRTGTPEYHVRLGELLTNQSMAAHSPEVARRLSKDAARTEEAHRQIRQAIEEYGRVAIEYPDDLDRRARALDGYAIAIGPCVAAPGFTGEVDELNRRLEAELPKLLAAFPDSSDCQWHTSMIYRGWAFELLANVAYLSTAEHALSESTGVLERLSLSDPKWPNVWFYLADTYIYLGDIQLRSAKLQDAEAAFRRAMEIFDKHAVEIAAYSKPKMPLWIANDYVQLAYFLASTHREDEAAKFVRKAAHNAKLVTNDPVASATTLWLLAAAQVGVGDDDGYRETCKALADVPVDSLDDLMKVRQNFAWSFAPDALDDLGPPVKRAEELVANNSLSQRHIALSALGVALYRDGQYERAADELAASIDAYDSDSALPYDIINFQQLFLAMSKWQLDQKDEARKLLAKTLPDVDKQLQSPSCGGLDRLMLEVLRREAEALIEPNEADEAVENNSRTSEEPIQ
jgi:tetratricopeptide (TPR) repeat protein